MTPNEWAEEAELTLGGRQPQPAITAWPEHYRDAARAIAAEAETDPHDPHLYWRFFPETD